MIMTNKQRNIIIKSLTWFITLFIIIFIGASNVFGATISSYETKYYWYTANDSSSITSTAYRSGSDNKLTLYGATAPTYTNGEGFNGFYNKINYTISKGSIYTLSLAVSYSSLQESEFGTNNINNRLLSTDYAHCSNCTITAVSGSIRKYNSTNQSVSGLYDYVVQMSYTFVATSDASTWYIGSYTNNDRTMGVDNHLYTSVIMVNNLEISNDNSSTIINQNDTIINQNQQMIDQNQQNTQDIINNQNSNNQKIIDSNSVCKELSIEDAPLDGFIGWDGSFNEQYGYNKSTDFISLNQVNKIVLLKKANTNKYACFYGSDKSNINCYDTSSLSDNYEIPIPNNASYFRTNFEVSDNLPIYSICSDGNQALNDSLDEQNKTSKGILGKLGELITNMFSTDGPDTSGLDNVAGWLPPGPIDSLLTLPLSLIQSILNGLGSSCSPLSVALPFVDSSLTIPCINVLFSQINGVSTFYSWLGPIVSAFILYYYFRALYSWIDKKLSLQEEHEWGGV